MNLNLPLSSGPRIVVIGGGFAGLSLIKNIKLPNTDYKLVLIDQNNFHTFQPLLYQVATGGLEVGSIAFPLRRFLKSYKNTIYRMAQVTRIDCENNLINTNLGELKYDYLVIASGSVPNFFGNKDLEQHAMVLKTIQQSINMRSIILRNLEEAANTNDIEKKKSFMTFVFAGGGPTGVEMAGALVELKKHIFNKDYPELDINLMQIYIVEAGNRLLSSMSQV